MVIDWEKAEEKPDSKIKVEGVILLDLRSKINSLEGDLAQSRMEVEAKIQRIDELEEIIEIQKNEIKQLTEKFSQTLRSSSNLEENITLIKSQLEQEKQNELEIKKEKERIERELNNKSSKIHELEKEIGFFEDKLVEKEKEMEHFKQNYETHINETDNEIDIIKDRFRKLVNEKEIRIHELKDELKKVNHQLESVQEKLKIQESELARNKKISLNNLSQKNREIKELENQLKFETSEKEIEVEVLKDDLAEKLQAIDNLKNQVKNMKEDLSELKGAPQVIQNIKDILVHKGFLADKEFYKLLEKYKEKNLTIKK